jgi:hypothetical protein
MSHKMTFRDTPLATAVLPLLASLRRAGTRQRCLFMGVERKSSVRGQTDANDPERKWNGPRLLMNCAQTAQRRRRDVEKCTNRSRHVSRGRNNEMNGPRRGLEFLQ